MDETTEVAIKEITDPILSGIKSTIAHWEQGVQAIPRYLDLALQTLERQR